MAIQVAALLLIYALVMFLLFPPSFSREPEIYSDKAILVDVQLGKLLYSKQPDEQCYPASLTKMMTVLLAVEMIDDLQLRWALPEDVFYGLEEENASMAGFLPGEQVKLEDLVYGAMLPSGAEAARGLAWYLCGSEECFAEKMNQYAKALYMKDTHYINATGLHNVQHYSSVRDTAKLLSHALKNERFRAVFTARRYYVSPTDLHPNGIMLESTLFQKLQQADTGFSILGGKTGFTDEAGLCLASLCLKDGRQYLLVTAGAPSEREKALHLQDALTLYHFYLDE